MADHTESTAFLRIRFVDKSPCDYIRADKIEFISHDLDGNLTLKISDYGVKTYTGVYQFKIIPASVVEDYCWCEQSL